MSLEMQHPSGASNGPGAFQCPNCGKFYKYRRNMLSHFKLECGMEPQFCCQFCPRRYKQKSKLQIHVGSKHSNEFSAIWGDSSGKQEISVCSESIFCSVCTNDYFSISVPSHDSVNDISNLSAGKSLQWVLVFRNGRMTDAQKTGIPWVWPQQMCSYFSDIEVPLVYISQTLSVHVQFSGLYPFVIWYSAVIFM